MRTACISMVLLVFAAGAQAADSIATVLPCGTVGSAGGLGAGTDLTRYTVDTTKFPHAVCNDGSPAVFYYAPSTRVEDRGKWIIFLQGGGACVSGQLCAERWCSINTNYGMDKMSSTLTKESIRGAGFLSPDARNQFRTWNRVLVYYCSSDQWAGTKENTLTASSTGGVMREYRIEFRGSQIVDAVLDTLRNAEPGAGRRRVVRHDAGPVETASAWPDLDTANVVLFAGSSGGGNGARSNVDRVGAKLRATNPGLADYRAIIEAIFTPDTSELDYSHTTFCANDPILGCTYASFTKASFDAIDVGLIAARGDESCRQFHAAREPGSEWICSDKDHVLLHHITTPFFLRQDLQDPQIGGGFVESGLGTASDYATRLEATLRNFPVPEEPRGAAPGVWSVQCAQHEGFTNNSVVFETKIGGMSYHDTVWNWWTGAQPQQVITSFNGVPGPVAGCPEE